MIFLNYMFMCVRVCVCVGTLVPFKPVYELCYSYKLTLRCLECIVFCFCHHQPG